MTEGVASIVMVTELGDRRSPHEPQNTSEKQLCGGCRREQLYSDALQMGALQCSQFRGQWATPEIMAETQMCSTDYCQRAGEW